jgi:hypothetical protein
MPIPVTITLNSIVGTPGLFNLYSNTDSYTTAFETGVSASGNVITSTNVPDGTTSIKIKSTLGSCTYEITKSIVGLPTPTPTPTNTTAPSPATPTPTPTPCPNNCSSSLSGSYVPSTFYNYGNYCLDLSSASNGATITIQYSSNYRPNRYDISDGLGIVVTSGWVGDDNSYDGVWGMAGSLSGPGDGTISFTYNSSKTYTLSVQTGGANPDPYLSMPANPSDDWDVTITCGGTIITSTPTVTPTSTPYRIVANDLWIGDSGDVEFGDDTSCAHTSPVNTIYGGVDAWLYSATNICDATSIEADNSLGFNWVLGDMTPNAYIWVSQTGITYDSTLGSYVRLFKRSGSTNTLLPSGTCINCLTINEPTPTPTPIPQITVNIYGRQNTPYDAVSNNVQLVYQTYYTSLGSVNHTTSGIQKSLVEQDTFLVSPSVSAGGYINLGAFLRETDGACDYLEVNVNVFAAGAYLSSRFTNSTGSLLTDYGCGLQGSINGVSIPVSQAIDVYITPTSTGVCGGSALIPPGLECLTTNQ